MVLLFWVYKIEYYKRMTLMIRVVSRLQNYKTHKQREEKRTEGKRIEEMRKEFAITLKT